MSNSALHCPMCNATQPTGLGLIVYEQTALVEWRCQGCGEIFFACDRREQELVQLATDTDDLENSPSQARMLQTHEEN